MERLRIKIVGDSGAGLLSSGKIFIKALHRLGYYVVSDREFPSVIKGGRSCYTINISSKPIYALSKDADIMLAIDKFSMQEFFDSLRSGGVLVHGYDRLEGIKDLLVQAKKRRIKVVSLKARQLAMECGADNRVVNILLLGMMWKVLGFPLAVLQQEVKREYADKVKILELDLKVLQAAYERVETKVDFSVPRTFLKKGQRLTLNGNYALSLGAVHCGVRAYFAYPMSPASSILTYLAEMAPQSAMLVKQAEDEITVVQMALGAMFMGTRALAATSGGGYDLMTETVSLAGMIENPLVIVMAQRPGPATGLPTWTAQGDLNLAVYSAHGEFPRVVVSLSDPADAFYLIQEAFNLAEVYQVPVIVLTEKDVAESNITVKRFQLKSILIQRGLLAGPALKKLKNSDRYQITSSGLSQRWLPGSADAYYHANSDEHLEDGVLTEEAEVSQRMCAKRMKKMALIEKVLPEPVIYGVKNNADISFVGWGSTKKVMLDMIEEYRKLGKKVNYLHYNYVYPLKINRLESFFRENCNVHLIEVNYLGQLGQMIEAKGKNFQGKFLKYDGRPFFLEDVRKYVDCFSR